MAFLSSLNIPLSGMTAERFRLDIISQNIANADNVASTPEEAYKRQMVVFGEDKTFKKLLFAKLNSGEIASYNYVKYRGVEAKAVVDDPPRQSRSTTPPTRSQTSAATSTNPTLTWLPSSSTRRKRRTCIPRIWRCSKW